MPLLRSQYYTPFFRDQFSAYGITLLYPKKSQLLNALKYSTAFPAAYFLMLRDSSSEESMSLVWAWLCAQLLNSVYSYVWDVERDWDISWFSAKSLAPVLKSPKLFQGTSFYYYCLVSNLVLRLGWSYKLFGSPTATAWIVICMMSLEVFRRFQWIYIRIETELRKINNQTGLSLFNEEAVNGQEGGGIQRVKSHNVMLGVPLF
eukprot:TRINITY_DN183_c0_g1_i1.p2 TRINITY_DN183_c0_g1~~TRINITY_DN183_c0_g1_i1.p2  ORF type:complete len:204 (-),score=5.62 TRINITY_DN183_c0_g1_i1:141-752(-)